MLAGWLAGCPPTTGGGPAGGAPTFSGGGTLGREAARNKETHAD